MPSPPRIVLLGTGGTISASADSAAESVAYRAGSVSVGTLAEAVESDCGALIESEQIAQIDSKDMDFATWRRLALRIDHHLARDDVNAVVVTHGTDTLEETAWFVERVLAPAKPVVFTAAMRPATSRQADGPQNLADACTVAVQATAGGTVCVLAGSVHSARAVCKVHPYRLDAFSSGEAGPLGFVEAGRLRPLRAWPDRGVPLGTGVLAEHEGGWPFVAIVTSTAGADGRSVAALVEAGCAGIVVAATGNGSVHAALESRLAEAAGRGVASLRATRCLEGSIVEPAGALAASPSAVDLTPQKARVELILHLLAERAPRP